MIERKIFCDVCGKKFVGPEELVCENGHSFCECHEEFFMPTTENKWEYISRHCANVNKNVDDDAVSEFYTDCIHHNGENFNSCPICKFDAIDKNTVIAYLLKRAGITERELLKELKEKFGNDFKAYLDFVK